MDYRQVMYIATALKNDVAGREDKLKQIYEDAVKNSDSYKELATIREEMVFFDNGTGAGLLEECDELFERIISKPEEGPQILDKMAVLAKSIRAEEARSMELLKSCDKNDIQVTVLSREVNERYGRKLNRLAASMIFELVALGGTGAVMGLRWNDESSVNKKIKIINNEIKNRRTEESFEPYFWKLVKLEDNSRIKFANHRYVLEDISYDEFRSLIKDMVRFNANLYAAVKADDKGIYRNDQDREILYVGMGNVVSCPLDDLIKRLVEKKVFTVAPSMLCELMNRAVNAQIIYERTRKGECLFCGKPLDKGMVCRDHFKIEHT